MHPSGRLLCGKEFVQTFSPKQAFNEEAFTFFARFTSFFRRQHCATLRWTFVHPSGCLFFGRTVRSSFFSKAQAFSEEVFTFFLGDPAERANVFRVREYEARFFHSCGLRGFRFPPFQSAAHFLPEYSRSVRVRAPTDTEREYCWQNSLPLSPECVMLL